MTILENANQFFDACETGKGWAACKAWCHPGATFSAQADALAEVSTVEQYAEWMKGLLGPVPDGHYELKAMSLDDKRQIVTAFAVFHGTHTVDGPVPATNKTVAADYVYAMQFEGEKITHMTKIWNDGHSLKQLGWA
ncbi:MAG: nuclear transport factor 2 family protein [Burkholderiaceae bacterium]